MPRHPCRRRARRWSSRWWRRSADRSTATPRSRRRATSCTGQRPARRQRLRRWCRSRRGRGKRRAAAIVRRRRWRAGACSVAMPCQHALDAHEYLAQLRRLGQQGQAELAAGRHVEAGARARPAPISPPAGAVRRPSSKCGSASARTAGTHRARHPGRPGRGTDWRPRPRARRGAPRAGGRRVRSARGWSARSSSAGRTAHCAVTLAHRRSAASSCSASR